jgi:TPR repeat protein
MLRLLIASVGATMLLGACATIPKSCRALSSLGAATYTLPNGRNVVMMDRLVQASIAELRCGADQGSQAAQVLLAKRFETGDGVPRDPERAVALYERAATAVPLTTAIYSPPVTLGGRGQMLFLNNPNAGPGSAEAQYRLGRMLIEGRGTSADPERGRGLIERAARQGYAPATEK